MSETLRPPQENLPAQPHSLRETISGVSKRITGAFRRPFPTELVVMRDEIVAGEHPLIGNDLSRKVGELRGRDPRLVVDVIGSNETRVYSTEKDTDTGKQVLVYRYTRPGDEDSIYRKPAENK